ncbi:prepilin-type N-terminal cleavage/methylation domain-containing protein [Photobacterium profundum]|uniref:type IV pilus modification PilV family protein n=1 Tax=Photobacterium profundum TaxID=74109 RepID=UPI003D103EF2
MTVRLNRGFTLIEGIITIVILGIAMVTLTSFLFPQAERSATPYYQARSAAIGNAFLNEILSRKFDENSDPNGDSVLRCGELELGAKECTLESNFGPKSDEIYWVIDPDNGNRPTTRLNVSLANDVDDFDGCWGDKPLCDSRYKKQDWRGPIESLISGDKEAAEKYLNMAVSVLVSYDSSLNSPSAKDKYLYQHKRIVVEVDAGRYGKYDFVAYRSNY